MKIIYHGHSCFELRGEAGSIVFDPYCPDSVPGLRLPPLSADLVICSHGHSDHSYAEGVRLSGRAPELVIRQYETYHDEARGAKRGNNTCTYVELDGVHVLHLGDLGSLEPDFTAELARIDVLLVPVGGFYTIDARQAKLISDRMDAAVTIPMHYRIDRRGLQNIAPVRDFLSAYPRDELELLDSHVYELGFPVENGRRIIVPKINPECLI